MTKTSHALMKLSTGTRPIMRQLPTPAITMNRLLKDHKAERIMRRLTTPSLGTYAITISFHRVWATNHAETLVLVESLLTKHYMLLTQKEFIQVAKESLACRAALKKRPRKPATVSTRKTTPHRPISEDQIPTRPVPAKTRPILPIMAQKTVPLLPAKIS